MKIVLLSVMIASVVGDTAATIAAIAAGVAGTTYIASWLVRMLRDATKVMRRALNAWQILEALPPWMESTNGAVLGISKRLDSLEGKTDDIQEPVEAIARGLEVAHRRR